jgi:hypothetical protein
MQLRSSAGCTADTAAASSGAASAAAAVGIDCYALTVYA